MRDFERPSDRMVMALTGNLSMPGNILTAHKGLMEKIARSAVGTYRTGGSPGPEDQIRRAFRYVRVCLPWPDYNREQTRSLNTEEDSESRYFGENEPRVLTQPTEAALEHAAKYHPSWDSLGEGQKCVQATFSHMLLGKNLDTPAFTLITYTEGGFGEGYSAQAIRIARDIGTRVVDLGHPDIGDQLFRLYGIRY